MNTLYSGGLKPQYRTYDRQKCFIAYSEQACWAEDLLAACQEILARPEFNLEADYARKHFHPDLPLRSKALELIANARYGIYDLSSWQDEKGEWHIPRNVFIELGMAIALNRPTLLLRHASNRKLELPECLKSLDILEFSGQTTLKRVLAKRLPDWVKQEPEQAWWNRYCHFGGRLCEYRQAHPRAQQWGQKALHGHISYGPDVDSEDFGGVVEDVLERFSDVKLINLNDMPLMDGYDLVSCTHCQAVRSTPFAIYRITLHTPAETFVAIGISLALEKLFDYKIQKILLTKRKKYIPSLLSGYEVIIAQSDRERKRILQKFLPKVIRKIRDTSWKPRPLPSIDISVQQEPGVGFPKTGTERPAKSREKPLVYLDQPERRVWVVGKWTPRLASLEYKVFKLLYTRIEEVVTRDELAAHAWPDARGGVSDEVINAVMARLRRKIEPDPENPNLLKIIPGQGYMLEAGKAEAQDYSEAMPNLPIFFSEGTRQVWVLGQPTTPLTALEYNLFELLYNRLDEVVTREELVQAGWPHALGGVSDESINAVMARLRSKIEPDPTKPRFLKAIRGQGYRLEVGKTETEAHRETTQVVEGERSAPNDSPIFLDEQTREVWVLGQPTKRFTALESQLFQLLYNRLGEVVTKEELLQAGWPDAQGGVSDEAIHALMARLRRKIEPNLKKPRFLKTIRGQGYRLEAGKTETEAHSEVTPTAQAI